MKSHVNNFAFIDGANLYKGVVRSGWVLDYKKFKVWLRDKYGVSKAFIFLGLIPQNKNLYVALQEAGYIVVFKEISFDTEGKPKGNCDSDLVLKTVVGYYEKEFDKVIIVSSDGDFASLVKFLQDKDALLRVISPSRECSFLIRRTNAPLVYLDSQMVRLGSQKVEVKEKAPNKDGTLPGPLS